MNTQAVHGTPITPKPLLQQMRGASFCVSYFRPDQLEDVIPLLGDDSLLLLDNGAWSAFQRGTEFSREYWDSYWTWAKDILDRCPQAVAVVPDVIGGTVEQNWNMYFEELPESLWGYEHRLMMVWHLAEPLSYLEHLVRSGFGYIAFGSTGEFLQVGSAKWDARIDEAFATIDRLTLDPSEGLARPRIHMMRGLGQLKRGRHAFQTADSTNVAQNHHRYKAQPEHVAAFRARIESCAFPAARCAVWPQASIDEAADVSPAQACREIDACNAALAATMLAYHNEQMESRSEAAEIPAAQVAPTDFPRPAIERRGVPSLPAGRPAMPAVGSRRAAWRVARYRPQVGTRSPSGVGDRDPARPAAAQDARRRKPPLQFAGCGR
jgi:hypothetical protein